jgi:tRNA-uridine 2-sulfurtransferase
MSSKGRVLVAMSGGVDSTVAAIMLHQQGYQVIGMTMKTWDYASAGGSKKETGCCSLDSINDARQVAVDMGFPHYIIDIREEFGESVIDDFVGEYLAGRTPNPCVLCNTHIKWEALLRRADAMDCEFIATGHYAKIRQENGRYVISRGLDVSKDQSYVLWGLSQECMARTFFPLGGFHKHEIKAMVQEMGYPGLASKSESYEICFIPDNDYRGFLKRRVDGLEERVQDGIFVDTSGNVIGSHDGYPFFTVGQRKGLGTAFGEPMFVTEIRPDSNTVVLGKLEELDRNGMLVRNINLQKYESIPAGLEAVVKVRYKDAGTQAQLFELEDRTKGNRVRVEFLGPVSAIAPGQSAVFYEGEDVIGGGHIQSSFQLPTSIHSNQQQSIPSDF